MIPWPLTGQRTVKVWWDWQWHCHRVGPVIDLGRPDRVEPLPDQPEDPEIVSHVRRHPSRRAAGKFGAVSAAILEELRVRPLTTSELADKLARFYPGLDNRSICMKISGIVANNRAVVKGGKRRVDKRAVTIWKLRNEHTDNI